MVLNAIFGLGVVSIAGTEGQIAWEAHIGGFLFGSSVFGFFDRGKPRRRCGDPPHFGTEFPLQLASSLARSGGPGQNVAATARELGAGGNEMNVASILKSKGRGVFTATTETSLLEIAKLLEHHGIGCIVVDGDEGKVAGIVSERDLVRAIGRSGTKVLKEPVSKPT